MKLRLGDVSQNSARLTAVVLSSGPVTATIKPAGLVNVNPQNERVVQPYLATVLVTFDDLQPLTNYSYTVTQGGVTIQGSFRTLPVDQLTPFSFIVGTCDGPQHVNPMDTFQTIRKLAQEFDPPVLFLATIDDVHYCDTYTVSDPETGFVSSGRPQDTGNAEDYAIGWAAHFGMFRSKGKWRMIDRQWVYQNLPHICSGGDHMIAGNHCRGMVGKKDYFGCDRSPGGLEDVAIAEWDAFFGAANPPPMRAGELYWGKEVGPVRLVSTDIQKHCEPYDPNGSGTGIPTDGPMLGQTQIDDFMSYLDTDQVPFKLLLMESGFSVAGQSWLEWHPSEAQSWKSSLDQRPNLNGMAGNFLGIYGDNHSLHSVSFDTFWSFCAGTYGDSLSVGHNLDRANFGWGGNLLYLWNSFRSNGDRLIGGFLHVIVHADRSPQEIEIRIINGGTGKIEFSRTLTHGSINNQFN